MVKGPFKSKMLEWGPDEGVYGEEPLKNLSHRSASAIGRDWDKKQRPGFCELLGDAVREYAENNRLSMQGACEDIAKKMARRRDGIRASTIASLCIGKTMDDSSHPLSRLALNRLITVLSKGDVNLQLLHRLRSAGYRGMDHTDLISVTPKWNRQRGRCYEPVDYSCLEYRKVDDAERLHSDYERLYPDHPLWVLLAHLNMDMSEKGVTVTIEQILNFINTRLENAGQSPQSPATMEMVLGKIPFPDMKMQEQVLGDLADILSGGFDFTRDNKAVRSEEFDSNRRDEIMKSLRRRCLESAVSR